MYVVKFQNISDVTKNFCWSNSFAHTINVLILLGTNSSFGWKIQSKNV
jgi:hypothetical protein